MGSYIPNFTATGSAATGSAALSSRPIGPITLCTDLSLCLSLCVSLAVSLAVSLSVSLALSRSLSLSFPDWVYLSVCPSGLRMEIEDGAFPLFRGVELYTDARQAFQGAKVRLQVQWVCLGRIGFYYKAKGRYGQQSPYTRVPKCVYV